MNITTALFSVFVKSRPKSRVFCLSAVLVACAVYTQVVMAAQVVDWLRVEPSGVPAGTATPVLASAQVGTDPTLLPQSVTLLRYDESGNYVANLGAMYDDGTHGDLLEGDGIFSSSIVIDEAEPMSIVFKASVSYRGLLRRIVSEPFSVLVQSTMTAEETILALVDALRNGNKDQAISYFGGSDIDRQVINDSDPAGLQRLADTFAQFQLVKESDNYRVYSAPASFDGQVMMREFTMMRNELGEWFVVSW